MTYPSTRPTRLLRIIAGLARWSLGLLLALWLLLAIAWGTLHGWIVPRIGDFRPQLEAQAARILGVPVRIGAVTARSQGLLPSIELAHVALLDAQGRAALQLPRVVVALSPRSLLTWGVEQLYIEGPQLDVRRTADGRIFVAGIPLVQTSEGNSPAADWLFSQSEVLIRGGTLRWTDEQRGAPALALEKVDVLLRNHNWQHNIRLDATPPASWGARFTLAGRFRSPLLHPQDGNWQHWRGQLFADFSQVDVAHLRQHANLGVDVAQGRGQLRAWADIQQGRVVGGTADVALSDVNATLAPDLQALAFSSITGRVGGQWVDGGFTLYTQGLQFVTDDGLHWPDGNLRVQYIAPAGRALAQTQLQADRLDLAALAQIGARLPLGTAAHGALRTYRPQGLVETLQASWRGPLDAPQQYQARGKVRGLALAGNLAADGAAAASALGLRGATVDFDLTQAGGKASLAIDAGALVLPGVFEEAVVPVDSLNADIRWQVQGQGAEQRIAVQANGVRFANADMQGEAHATWHTSDASSSPRHARFPGVLDLTGSLTRADGTRVHRYLPLGIPAESRHYVRDAVRAGSASSVQFRVRGDLNELPFNHPKQGDFHIAARVRDVTYAYVPKSLQPPGALPWPALAHLAGELIFDRSAMRVRAASGSFVGAPGVHLSKVEAEIPDLGHSVVSVHADARGPLTELLSVVRTSPLARMTGNALDDAAGAGNADFQLRLQLPISTIDQSKVQGSITLAGNDVRITPDTPLMSRARGTVQFSEGGFSLHGVQARALGGDLRLEGGMRALPAGSPATEPAIQLRAQGVATAQGLQQAHELGLVAQLARSATGSAPYTLALAFRRGVPEVQLTSTLQGLALALPAPLAKPAQSSQPLRFETQVLRESLASVPAGAALPALRDQVTLDLGSIGSATWQREIHAGQTRVLRGAIGVGLANGETAPLPAEGVVVANLNARQVNADAWQAALARTAGAGLDTRQPAAPGALPDNAQDYLPTRFALRAQELTVQGRTLHQVVLGGSRENTRWRANLHTTELDGYAEYRPTGAHDNAAGQLFARLSRMQLPQNQATQFETLLEDQPSTLPALDVVVEDFELRGRKLGRIEVEAQNRSGAGAQREWRLSKFNILAPEASLTASGNWAVMNTASASVPRRTLLNFRLDIRDSGDLLTRFGMEHVVRRGKGVMEGQVAWIGAPMNPDYRSMTGQVNLNVESGQFLKADPGLAKLLGVLSLQTLPRRLTLDFRDVFSEGFAFDFVRGDVRIDQGVASTNNLQMKGVNAAVLMEGSADLDRETQNLHVVVVPEINAMTASLVATAINPVVGLGSFFAQMLLRGPLIASATQEFRIDGPWADPRIERITAKRSKDSENTPAGSGAVEVPKTPPQKTGETP